MSIKNYNIDNDLLILKSEIVEVSSSFDNLVIERLSKQKSKKISNDIRAIIGVIASLTILTMIILIANFKSSNNSESFSLYRSQYVTGVATAYSLNENSYNNLR